MALTIAEAVPTPARAHDQAVPIFYILVLTFFGSISGGAFWSCIFFLTARDFGFSSTANLVLAIGMGAAYAGASIGSDRLVAAVTGRISRRGLIVTALGVQAIAAAILVVWPSPAMVWPVAIVGAAWSAVVWPLAETFLAAGRHGHRLRAALGVFCLTWTSATAVPLLLVPIFGHHNLIWAAMGVVCFANTIAIAGSLFLPRVPAHHDVEVARQEVGKNYPLLRRASLWLLPMSYVLMANLAPILPYKLAALGIPRDLETIAAALWMVARFGTLFVLWQTRFWHGRWAPLLLGCAALLLGFAAILAATSAVVALCGLALFGAGMAMIYYASLYYSLSVGHAAVGAAGLFEGLIGVGYVVGPLLGLAGTAVQSQRFSLGLCWVVAFACCVPTFQAALASRRVDVGG